MNGLPSLKKLGFSEKEIQVYFALQKNDRLTPTAISRATKINRATVYNITRELMAKGVIAEDLGARTATFVALPPKNLEHLLSSQKRELKEKEASVEQAIREIQLLRAPQAFPLPKIRFIEQDHIQDFIYKQAAKWDKSAEAVDRCWWGFQDNELIEHHEKWLHWLWKEIHTSTHVKLLSLDSALEKRLKNRYPHREIKTLSGSDFNATTWIVGEYLIMIVSRQSPAYLVEINDCVLAQNMRSVFKQLWERV